MRLAGGKLSSVSFMQEVADDERPCGHESFPCGDHGNDGSDEHEENARPHVPGNVFTENDHGEDGGEHGLEEEPCMAEVASMPMK